MSNFKFAIFDFDGTLVDSAASMVPIYRNSLKAVGEDCTAAEAREYMHHSLLQVIRMRGMSDEKQIASFVKEIIRQVDLPENVALIETYSETISVLKSLKERGMKLAIVSGNSSTHIREYLSKEGIADSFVTIVGNDVCPTPKPAPDPLLMAMQAAPEFTKEEVIYIGDSLQDVECAKNAGVTGILLDRCNEHSSFAGERARDLTYLLR